VVKGCDGFFKGWGDLVGAAFEVDGVGGADFSGGSKGEVEIEQGSGRTGAQGGVELDLGGFEEAVGDFAGGGVFCGVLAGDFHLEDFVGERVGVDFGVGEEGDEAFLESAEAAFDFAFGLRGWGDEVGDAEGAQGALELAAGVEVVVGGTGAEEAQGVGVDGKGDAVALEGFAEVLEVGPGGVAGDEAAGDVEAGVVVEGEQEGLFFGAGPPLVDGAVVLEEFAEAGAAEAAVGAWFFWGRGNEEGQAGFDVGFDTGAGAFEAVEAQEFVGDELEVAGGLERDEFAQEGDGGLGPGAALVATAGVDVECLAVSEPEGAKLVATVLTR
jgi:hypothetical protein